jgi:hypothetical protein
MSNFVRGAVARRLAAPVWAAAVATLMTACGGGGGGDAPRTPPASAASLSITTDATSTSSSGAPVALHAVLTHSTATPTWTLSGPGSLDATTGGDVVYTPPDAESLTQAAVATVTATAGSLDSQVAISVGVGRMAGQHWQSVAPPTPPWTGTFVAADYVQGRYVALSYDGVLGSSADGRAWTRLALATAAWPDTPTSYLGLALAHSPTGRLVATGAVSNGNERQVFAALYSDDGATWRVAATPADMWADSVTWDGARFVALSYWQVYTSPDGAAWTLASSIPESFDRYTRSMAHGHGRYVVVGGGGLVASSADAVAWTVGDVLHLPGDASTAADLWRVAFIADRFIAVGARGVVATSADGITWNVAGSATQAGLHSIAVSTQGELVAVGEQGVAETSIDGVHWTLRDTASTDWMMDVVFGNGAFLGVGANGFMALSDD